VVDFSSDHNPAEAARASLVKFRKRAEQLAELPDTNPVGPTAKGGLPDGVSIGIGVAKAIYEWWNAENTRERERVKKFLNETYKMTIWQDINADAPPSPKP
jgi:hypothetical protein